MSLTYRDLHSLDDLRPVPEVERAVWGMSDIELVPTSLLLVSVKCGGIVIGAFDGEAMVGFTYSFPGYRHGARLHWSHMTGVLGPYRGAGVGLKLKRLQRERVLQQDCDLIEWTYDPLQAANAHFNFSKLSVVVREYVDDVYGESESPLHRGAPTDRFVAQWWLRGPMAERDEVAAGPPLAELSVANPMRLEGRWWVCDEDVPLPSGAWFRVAIPPHFTSMLTDAPDLSRRWRLATRSLFSRALAAGHVVAGFEPDPATGGGCYVLQRRT